MKSWGLPGDYGADAWTLVALWVMGGVLSGWPLENESRGCLWQIISFIKPALPGSELHWSSSSGRFRLWGKL